MEERVEQLDEEVVSQDVNSQGGFHTGGGQAELWREDTGVTDEAVQAVRLGQHLDLQ